MSRAPDGCMLGRRSVLAGTTAGALALFGAPSAFAKQSSPRRDFRNGLCATSFSDRILDGKLTFTDGRRKASSPLELQRLMMAHGSSEVFARMGSSRKTGPRGQGSAMEEGKRRAQLAKSVNLPLNPEFLLCAHYGDMGGQPKPDFSDYPEIRLPRPWHEMGIEEMCDAMRIYGSIVAREILDTGVNVNVWDIGNEVELGIAGVAMRPMSPHIGGPGWTYKAPDAVDPEIGKMSFMRFLLMKPAEQVAWGKAHLWNYVGQIAAAVAQGIRQVDPGAVFATHTSAIASLMPEMFVGFYEALDEAGFHTRELGVSYYPTNTDRISQRLERFKSTARLAMARLSRPLYISEFGYAAGPVTYGGQNWANPVDGYPCTPKGQGDFLRDLTEWGVRENVLAGIRPWAPDFVGGGWQGMALFDAPVGGIAVARPGLFAIEEGRRLARRRSEHKA